MLDSDYHCVLCTKNSCKECYVILPENVEEHECKKEDIETFKTLKDKTKPCPNCNTLIYKIAGCSQIFCTHCKTPFCWNTGRVITNEFFHNPHYFDFINSGGSAEEVFRPGPSQPTQQNCRERTVSWSNLKQKLNTNSIKSRDIMLLSNVIRVVRHVSDVEIRKYNYNPLVYNENYRMSYLRNNITEKGFKQRLTTSERRQEKSVLYTDLLTLYCRTLEDLFWDLMEAENIRDNFDNIMNRIKLQMDFFDKCFEKISKDYKCVKLKHANYDHVTEKTNKMSDDEIRRHFTNHSNRRRYVFDFQRY